MFFTIAWLVLGVIIGWKEYDKEDFQKEIRKMYQKSTSPYRNLLLDKFFIIAVFSVVGIPVFVISKLILLFKS